MITNHEPSDASPASDEGSDGEPSPASSVAASLSRSGERSEEAGEPRERVKPASNSNAYARARG